MSEQTVTTASESFAGRRGVSGRGRGFSMIELLIVIAIILVLIGLLFGGWKAWISSSARQTTVSRLELLNSMLAELQAAGPNQFSTQWFMSPQSISGAGGAIAANQLDASQLGRVSIDASGSPYTINVALSGPLSVFVGRTNTLLYMTYPPTTGSILPIPGIVPPPAANAFNGIMTTLVSLPSNAKAIAGLGSTATLNTISPTTGVAVGSGAPVVLDGWGNPILFVPAGGMINVCQNVTANNTANPKAQTASTAVAPIVSPDGRPFWVSAGPDGDFAKGDDNIYSFDQK